VYAAVRRSLIVEGEYDIGLLTSVFAYAA
jgi:hypothetical protein